MQRVAILAALLLATSLPASEWPLGQASASHYYPTATDICAGEAYAETSGPTGTRHWRFGVMPGDTTNRGCVDRSGWVAIAGTPTHLYFYSWTTGVLAPELPDGDAGDLCAIEIYRDDSAVLEKSFDGGATCPASTARFTWGATETSEAGTFRLRIRVAQANEVHGNYHADSDTNGVKGAMVLSLNPTSITSPTGPYAAGDTLTFTVSFNARESHQDGGVAFMLLDAAGAVVKQISGTIPSGASAINASFVIGDSFTASSTTYGLAMVPVGESALTGVPWTVTGPPAPPLSLFGEGSHGFKRMAIISVVGAC